MAGLFGRACRRRAVTSTCPHTLPALVDIHLGPIAAPGFDAKQLVPCPQVFHIPLGYSHPRRGVIPSDADAVANFVQGAVRLFGRAPRDTGGENVASRGQGVGVCL